MLRYAVGSGASTAFTYSMHVARSCHGSSPYFHHASGAIGFFTDSRIRSIFSSTHFSRSAKEIYS